MSRGSRRLCRSCNESAPARDAASSQTRHTVREFCARPAPTVLPMQWFTRQRAAYAVAAVILALLGWRSVGSGPAESAAQAEVMVRTYARPPAAPAETAALVVYVVGRVARPGVYRLRAGSRLQAALRAAGGPRPGADLMAVNLAAPLTDGQQVMIPKRGEALPGGSMSSPTQDAPISLSRASQQELEGLDGIGPTLAARIIAWRDEHGGFRTVDELGDVPGIGDARLEALREQVTP